MQNSRQTKFLPAPFAWCEIPAGEITLTDIKGYLDSPVKVSVTTFVMSRYPVTCAQYGRFMDAGGYVRRECWTDAGWEWVQQEKATQPDFWWNDYFNQPDRPVIGVSLYEALAFCHWLSDATDQPGITLPGEAQWQRAAQADDGQAYPWGAEFDPTRCNSKESGFVTTTVVNHYPQGASLFGVMDMSGNVWEWCLTEWISGRDTVEGDETRVMRGGSWFDSGDDARVTHRRDSVPFMRFSYYGFRCCMPVS